MWWRPTAGVRAPGRRSTNPTCQRACDQFGTEVGRLDPAAAMMKSLLSQSRLRRSSIYFIGLPSSTSLADLHKE
uniref:Uncharacterized protein n=1 Tax=Arundo donax TaxID=35708 RepID=A0A0A9DEN4_ARUDO